MSKWFKGIRLKLLGLAIFPVFMLAGLSYFAVQALQESGEQIDKMIDVRLPLAQLSGQMNASLQEMMRTTWAILGAGRDVNDKHRYKEKYDEALKTFEAAAAEYEKIPRSEFAREQWRTFEKHSRPFFTALKQAQELMLQNTPEADLQASVIMRSTVRSEIGPIEDMFDTLNKARLESSRKEGEELEAQTKRTLSMILMMSVVASLIVFSAGIGIASMLARRLGSVTDLVASSSREVSVASEQLASASQELSSTSQEQASSLEQSAASLQEISSMVESNEQNARQTAETAETALANCESASESVSQLVHSMDEIQKSNERIESLAKLIEEIGEKTELIDEIVFQTKLLSFNASVEAERAGEHGRGFAVVAQEVGNLAQMSGRSAVEIAAIVKSAVKEAQQVSAENRKLVEKSVELGRTSVTSMSSVIRSSKDIVTGAQHILSSSQEQTQGIKQITLGIENLNKATQENAATSEEAAASSEGLADQSTQLNGLVEELFVIVDGSSAAGTDAVALPSRISAKKKSPSLKVHQGGSPAGRKTAAAAPSRMGRLPAPDAFDFKNAAGGEFDTSVKAWEKL